MSLSENKGINKVLFVGFPPYLSAALRTDIIFLISQFFQAFLLLTALCSLLLLPLYPCKGFVPAAAAESLSK